MALTNFLYSQTTVLHCGKIITMAGEPLSNSSVVVVNGKIDRIEKGFVTVPDGAKLVDLKNRTVMPGLIDCHVHLEWEQSRSSYNER